MKSSNHRAFTSIDLLVLLVIVLLLSVCTLGAAQNNRETANRVKCASNLRQIGQALLLYANENKGAYPRGTYDMQTSDRPTAYTHPTATPTEEEKGNQIEAMYCKAGPGPNDVSAALFRLVQTEDMTPEVFLCPSVQAAAKAKVKLPDAKSECNFSDPAQLNYSFANPYPSNDAVNNGYKLNSSTSAEFALAGDMNPGVNELITIKPDAAEDQLKKINSTNHGGDGQNVLYGDGHVSFELNPYIGFNHDNIYTYGKSGVDADNKVIGAGEGISGSPVGPDDSVLLPTAKQK